MSESDFTPLLGLPYLLSNQARKHATLNESLRVLDGTVQLSVLDRDMTAPPAEADEGARYLIGSEPSGEWAGHSGKIGLYSDGGWIFLTPVTGWRVWVDADAEFLVFDGTVWRGILPDEMQNLTALGVGATADAYNPLLAKLNASLFTALEAAYGGSGDLRFKLNKEASSNVLSLLFQDNYSTRAEIGLVGDDDLVFKTSPDGAIFLEGLRIDRSTGRVSFPQGSPQFRERLSANRTYYVNASEGSDTNSGLSSGASFATIQKAVETALSLDSDIYDVTISVADGSYAENVAISGGLSGVGVLNITGNTASSSDCVIAPASGNAITVENGARCQVWGFKLAGSPVYAVLCSDHATLDLRNIVFAGGSTAHVSAGGYSTVSISSNYEIAASTGRHMYANRFSRIQIINRIVTITGALHFGTGFGWANYFSLIEATGCTFTGDAASTTGRRYLSQSSSRVETGGGGASYFPGDLSGITGALSYYG